MDREPPSRGIRWRRIVATGLAGAVIVAVGSTRSPAEAGDVASAAAADAPYTFRDLPIGGGGFVTGLQIHPTTPDLIYARTDVGGLWRWNEDTTSWKQLIVADRVPDPEYGNSADYNVESVALAPSDDRVVYTAAGNGGPDGRILVSRDRGEHWSDGGLRLRIEGNNEYRLGPERLGVDPCQAGTAYFGSRTQGLWRTTNYGKKWSQIRLSTVPVGNADAGIGVVSVLFDKATGKCKGATKRLWVTVAGAGIYLSNDAGASFTKVYSDYRTPSDTAMTDDGTLFVAYQSGFGKIASIRRFTATRTAGVDLTTPPKPGYYLFGVDPKNPKRILLTADAVRDDYLFRSSDGGKTWQSLSVSLAYPKDLTWPKGTTEKGYMSTATFKFDPHHAGRIYFPQGIGVWRSDDVFDKDTAATFSFVSKGLEEMVTYDVIAPNGLPITAVGDRNGFAYTSLTASPAKPILTEQFSAGTSLAYAGRNPKFIAAVSSDQRAQFAPPDATWTSEPASGYSTDGGATWIPFKLKREDSTRLYGGNIAVSADASSIVWMPTIPSNYAQDPANAGKKPEDQKPLNVPYVSRDNGQTWTAATGIEPGQGIHNLIWWGNKKALDADLVTPGVFYLYTTRNGGEFFTSTDGGATWAKSAGVAPSSVDNDAHVFGQVRAEPGCAGCVWVSTAQGGLSYTTDGGTSWTKISRVQEAKAFGFGKAIKGSRAVVFANAKINDKWGIWRSVDKGVTWTLLSQSPGGYYTSVNTVNGDMAVAGRVYVGFSGNSFVYGEPARS